MTTSKKSAAELQKLDANRRPNGEFGNRQRGVDNNANQLLTPAPSESRLSVSSRGTLTGPGLKVTASTLTIGEEQKMNFSLAMKSPRRVAQCIEKSLDTGEMSDIENHPSWLFVMPEEDGEGTVSLHMSTSRRQARTILTADEAAELSDHLRGM